MVRFTDRPDMTVDVYRGRKTTMQQQHIHEMLLFIRVNVEGLIGAHYIGNFF